MGGAVDFVFGSVTISASTFANNSATTLGGAISNSGNLSLSFNTFAQNSSGISGGVLGNRLLGSSSPETQLSANILSGRGNVAVCDGPGISSNGYNVGSDATCSLSAAGDIQNANSLLGNLIANGGPTNTIMPQTGSPAIDRVPNDICIVLSAANDGRDQRGVARPDGVGLPPDSGSVELQLNSFFCVAERSGSLRYITAPEACGRGEYRLMQSANGSYAFCVGERSGSMRFLINSGASCARGEGKMILPRIVPVTICVGERSRSVRYVADAATCNARGEVAYVVVNPAG